MYSRRDFGKLALSAVPMASAVRAAGRDYVVSGVPLGVTTFSFRDLPRTPGQDNIGAVIAAVKSAGVGYIELNSADIESPAPISGLPKPQTGGAYGGMTVQLTPAELAAVKKANRDNLRMWRLAAKPAIFSAAAKKLEDGGIALHSYRIDFDDDCTESEIAAIFTHVKALGVGMIAAAANLDMARRLGAFGQKNNILVAFRNIPAASLAEARSGASSYRIDFDIGDFTAANRQAVAYIQENHASIGQIVVKDRTRDNGSNEEFGNGDAPIKPILKLLKEKQYGIPVFVQYEYLGLGTPVQEVKKCLAYVHAALV